MIEIIFFVMLGFWVGLLISCSIDKAERESNKSLHESKNRLIEKQQEYIETLEAMLADCGRVLIGGEEE